MINSFDNICIFGWMVNELKLKGAELIVYAKMYGDCQDGGPFPRDYEYFHEFTGLSIKEIEKAHNNLEKKGLIIHKDWAYDLRDCFLINNKIFGGSNGRE